MQQHIIYDTTSEVLDQAAQQAMRDLLQELPEALQTVVVASQDGLLLTGKDHGSVCLDEIAAIGASIFSLSEAISLRSHQQSCEQLLSQSGEYRLVILPVQFIVLVLIGKAGMNMGMVLNASIVLSQAINTIMQQYGEQE